MYVIDSAKKLDPARQWSLPDRVFFACGACQVLAYVACQSYGHAGFDPYWLRPAPGFRGNHIIVSDGSAAFDDHGWSKLDRLLSHTDAKVARWWPGWNLLGIDVPDGAPVERLDETPADADACLAVGDGFLGRGAALILLVPSSIVPQEHNAIINVRHPAMAGVRVMTNEPFRFDSRLLNPASR